jgi:DNA replication and repair protein RecF
MQQDYARLKGACAGPKAPDSGEGAPAKPRFCGEGGLEQPPLESLTVEGFRNLEPLQWRPAAGSHLLAGGNGAGKTSLLEAVYVLATTRSFRTAQLTDCVRWDGGGFRVAGEAAGAARTALEVAWRGTPGSTGEKSRSVNGKPTGLGEHLAVLPVVAWTAGDADLTTGPPGPRRRFLDRGVVGLKPGAVDLLARYRRALAHKRGLLGGTAAGRLPGADAEPRARSRRPSPAELAPWNELLATLGAEIVALRRAYAAKLAAELAAVEQEAGLGFPPLGLAYRPRPAAAAEGAAALHDALGRAAAAELARGRPLTGPHRDRLEVSWGGRPLRGTVSGGERKATGLLLLAAHGRVMAAAGRPPVCLLDDADAELAPPTLAAVWRVFAGPERGFPQLLATTNRPAVWRELEVAATHSVAAGRLVLDATPE